MERKPAPAKSRTRLSSVANSLRLIKAFSEDQYEIGISDLAKRLGLAKSTVHRLASDAARAGHARAERGRRQVSPRARAVRAGDAGAAQDGFHHGGEAVPAHAHGKDRRDGAPGDPRPRFDPLRHHPREQAGAAHGIESRHARAGALDRGRQGAARVPARGRRSSASSRAGCRRARPAPSPTPGRCGASSR